MSICGFCSEVGGKVSKDQGSERSVGLVISVGQMSLCYWSRPIAMLIKSKKLLKGAYECKTLISGTL